MHQNSLLSTSETLRSEPLPKTTAKWLQYFQKNRDYVFPISWHSSNQLTSEERELLAHSMPIFQLGESSEGNRLIKAGRDYVSQSGDSVLLEVLKLFILEEKRHAQDLARFMALENIPQIRSHWADRAFRNSRRGLNLELALSVLLTAEIIGLLYSRTLELVTQSEVLQQLARQIQHDEQHHLYFQASMLGQLRQKRSLWLLFLTHGLHRLFLWLTLRVVWIDHHYVFRAGGYTFEKFAMAAWQELEQAIVLSQIKNR